MTEIQSTWGWLLAIDLFCSGLGAGTFFLVGILYLITGDRFKSTVRFGAWASVAAVLVGVFALLLDVSKPFRAVVLFRSFVHVHSWMTWGAWLLFSAILLYGLFALFSTDPVVEWAGRFWKPLLTGRRIFQIVLAILGILVSVGVAGYTGILLSVLQFRPLWHTWLLPALFATSALLTGATLLAGYATLRERAEGAASLRLSLAIVIILAVVAEGAVLWLYDSKIQAGSADAVRSLQMLSTGPLAVVFWIVVVALGLAVPLLAFGTNLTGLRNKPLAVLAWTGLIAGLLGAWTLRYLVLSAGLPQLLCSPNLEQILRGCAKLFMP